MESEVGVAGEKSCLRLGFCRIPISMKSPECIMYKGTSEWPHTFFMSMRFCHNKIRALGEFEDISVSMILHFSQGTAKGLHNRSIMKCMGQSSSLLCSIVS